MCGSRYRECEEREGHGCGRDTGHADVQHRDAEMEVETATVKHSRGPLGLHFRTAAIEEGMSGGEREGGWGGGQRKPGRGRAFQSLTMRWGPEGQPRSPACGSAPQRGGRCSAGCSASAPVLRARAWPRAGDLQTGPCGWQSPAAFSPPDPCSSAGRGLRPAPGERRARGQLRRLRWRRRHLPAGARTGQGARCSGEKGRTCNCCSLGQSKREDHSERACTSLY